MTIVPITDEEVAALMAEPQGYLHLDWRRKDGTMAAGVALPARIIERIELVLTGCWRVGGWNSGNGFAKMSVCGRHRLVHRVVHHLLLGPIPPLYVVDHDVDSGCAFRDCCFPDHLRPTTVKDNTHRGNATLFR